ncbi:MAG: J domain-containing protein [Armatimonadetes bacterium]|nr:J domain-containing protein [Armatimonadota bacterium]
MSLGRRAYDLLRAYIGREWQRIETVFEKDARRELDEYLHSTPPPPPPQAFEAARREENMPPAASPPAPRVKSPAPPGTMTAATAHRVLNLEPNADLNDLRHAYKRLSERSLPSNFPEGSEERKKAADVHLRVQEAYDILLPRLDPRLRRFRSLDLD